MRNMLAFSAAVVIAVAGVGFYLDWFNIRSGQSRDGHKNFTLDVNTEKLTEDLRDFEHKVEKKLSEKNKKDDAPVKMPRVDSHQ